jgi:CubicO group peptidase (beta-lactamase class C family)
MTPQFEFASNAIVKQSEQASKLLCVLRPLALASGKALYPIMLLRFAFLALAACLCRAQDVSRFDQLGQSYASNRGFMGTMLAARDGKIVFSKGYGFADLEWKIPNSPDTKFRLGSVSKQFAAASILLLEEQGKLSVDDPVKRYVTDAPGAWDKITIFHLLTHTSGIPNFTSFPEYSDLKPFPATAAKLIARLQTRPLDFQPGEAWNYSNSGYIVLTYIVEKVSGAAYPEFLRRNIFDPLGMHDSGYDSNAAILPQRASGYTFNGGRYRNAGYIDMTVPQGAGGLYSTTGDLLKWEQALYGGKLLQPAYLAKMTTPFKDNYAFGVEVQTLNGRKIIEHGGAIDGFGTDLAYFPDEKLAVVVLENVAGGASPVEIANKLAGLVLGDPVEIEKPHTEVTLDSAVLGRYAGSYGFPAGNLLKISLQDGVVVYRLDDRQPIALFPESATLFFPKAAGPEIVFSGFDGQGSPGAVALRENGKDTPAVRLADAELKQRVGEAAERAASAARRYKEQKQQAGSEEALKRTLAAIASGSVDYAGMTAAVAQSARSQMTRYQDAVAKLGALQSVSFASVLPDGSDDYIVKFANGDTEWRISLATDGKIQTLGYHPL